MGGDLPVSLMFGGGHFSVSCKATVVSRVTKQAPCVLRLPGHTEPQHEDPARTLSSELCQFHRSPLQGSRRPRAPDPALRGSPLSVFLNCSARLVLEAALVSLVACGRSFV